MASPYLFGSTRHRGAADCKSQNSAAGNFYLQREHKKNLFLSQFENSHQIATPSSRQPGAGGKNKGDIRPTDLLPIFT